MIEVLAVASLTTLLAILLGWALDELFLLWLRRGEKHARK